jgi:hypothetical protein
MGGQGRKSRDPTTTGCALAVVLVWLVVLLTGCGGSDTGSTVQASVSSSTVVTSEPGTDSTSNTTTVTTEATSSTTTAGGTYVARFEGSEPAQLDMPDLEGLFIYYIKGGGASEVWTVAIECEGYKGTHRFRGPEEGTWFIDFPGTSAGTLEIADTVTPWVVELRPASSAETLEVPTETSGTGSMVFAIEGEATEIQLQKGLGDEGIYSVWAYTATVRSLVLNGSEPFEGSLKLPAGVTFLQIGGSGDWRLLLK